VIYTALNSVSEAESNQWHAEALDEVIIQYHGNAGGFVAKNWKLQPWLEEVMRYHHTFEKAEERPDVVAIVALANQLCHRFGLGVPEDIGVVITDELKRATHFTDDVASSLEDRIDSIRDIIK
jgi:hypothetical protein